MSQNDKMYPGRSRCIIVYLTFMWPCIVNVFFNQQDATPYNILYYCQYSTCFRRFLRPSSGAQNLYTQNRVYVKLACLLLPLEVAASKLDMYPMLCLQFLSSWWWEQKPPETCTVLTVINNFVWRYILLVILKKYNRIYEALTLGKQGGRIQGVLVRRPDGKRSLVRHRCRRWVNIKMHFKGMGRDGMDWIALTQARCRWRSLCPILPSNSKPTQLFIISLQ